MPGEPIQHVLAQVPEWRMPKVVGERRGLHHVRVTAAERSQQVGVPLVGVQALGHGSGDLSHLEAVGEPVVHKQAGAAWADHLGDTTEPDEERRADDAVAVSAERTRGEIPGTT